MRTVCVNASSNYDIIIGKGLLDSLGEYAKVTVGICRVCIVTDDTVDALYSERAEASLSAAGFNCIKFVIPHGESSKSTSTLIELVEFLAQSRLTRSDVIVALGGGVVGDLAGFAAAVYLRGIRFIQVPTTLLAAVDSSVGGKTAVDLVAGKNLMGAFHQPSLVLCDYETLDTLPTQTFADGCAEVIKYGVINDRPFFDRLKDGIKDNLEEVIATCVRHKADIVAQDEFDNGCRQLLNLGHTVGHAIELCSDLKVSHGSAVAIGMVIVTRISSRLGLCSSSELDELIAVLKAEGLPTACEYSAQELAHFATADKKRSGGTVSMILPYGIGNCKPLKVSVDELADFIAKGL